MRLVELRIDGYGILNNLHLDQEDLGLGLNIIYGSNEAGKSTLMGFIRAVLFGLKTRGWSEMPALRGGRPGGHLVFKDESGREYRLERYQQGRKEIKYGEEEVINRLTPAVYRNVFAFDVDEMRRFEELSQLEVSAYLYGAGTGVGAGRLTSAFNVLKKEMEEIFKPSGSKPAVNLLASEVYRLDREVAELQQQSERFELFNRRIVELEREWEHLNAERIKLEERLRGLENLERAWVIWTELETLKKQRGELNPVLEFPNSGLERLERLMNEKKGLPVIPAPTSYSLEERENALSDLEFNFRRLEGLNSELTHLEKRLEDIERQNDLLEAETNLSPVVPFWVAGTVAALMAALSLLAFLNNHTLGAVTLITTMLLGGMILASLRRSARENAQRREAQRQSRQYYSEQREKINQEIKRVTEARNDYLGYNQRLLPIALGDGEAALEDVVQGIIKLNQEKKLRQRLFYINQEINQLFQEAGVKNEEEFRSRADSHLAAKEIEKKVNRCEDRLLLIAGGTPEARGQLENDLKEYDQLRLDAEKAETKQKIMEFNAGLKKTGEELGAAREQAEALKSSNNLAEKMLEREMKLNAMRSQAEKWQIRCICRQLIEMAKEKHEQTRQPEVIKKASEYFHLMTGSKYRRVLATVGQSEIEVETLGGARLPIKALSRGTSSQLYLAIRLALARHYREVGLPIILDEVLVDFDAERLSGALRVLKQLAEERQIIYFTCHNHLIEAAAQIFEQFNVVYLEEGVKVKSEKIKRE